LRTFPQKKPHLRAATIYRALEEQEAFSVPLNRATLYPFLHDDRRLRAAFDLPAVMRPV
jgi:hypothetical protein